MDSSMDSLTHASTEVFMDMSMDVSMHVSMDLFMDIISINIPIYMFMEYITEIVDFEAHPCVIFRLVGKAMQQFGCVPKTCLFSLRGRGDRAP